jgi:phosphoribosylamine---glycine ligase
VKVLIVNMDAAGEGLALAVRAAKAGHQVKIWYTKGNHPTTGDGFKGVERVKNWLEHAKWANLIVPTGNHEFVKKFDHLKREGIRIFGPSEKSAALEIDRARGMQFFKTAGIVTPTSKEFGSLAEAEAHVRKTGARFVFKTLGDEADKSLSYVGKSAADLVARLQRWQKLEMDPKGPVMLQEVIDGIELGVSRWLGARGWVGPPNENFEFKKLLSGNCGPNCGESGTVMKYTAGESKLFDQVLKPLEDKLVAIGHMGDIDVNCIVDGEGRAWPLEFTTRLGWPAANIMWATHTGDPVEWMLDACNGKDSLKVSTKHACGIVIAQPDYPYSTLTQAEVEGIPIYGVTRENLPYLAPQSVKIAPQPVMQGEEVIEKPTWTTTGDYVVVTTGTGKTVKRACQRAYDTVKDLHIPNMIYRDDIGEKLEDEIPKLQAHGIATEWRFE